MSTDYGAFHLRITGNGWITMDCKACNRPVISATHMDLWDFERAAAGHQEGKHRTTGMPEDTAYKCPLTGEVED